MTRKWVLLFSRHRYRVLAGGRCACWCIGLLLSATAIANTANEPAFKTNLIPGSNNSDVVKLQRFLNRSLDTQVATTGPGSPGKETSKFGPATKKAVIAFQNKYANDILTPLGYKSGTGNVAAHTRKKLNSLYAELVDNNLESKSYLPASAPDTEDILHELPPQRDLSNQLDDVIDETLEAIEFIGNNNQVAKKKPSKKTYFSKLKLAPVNLKTFGTLRYSQGMRTSRNSTAQSFSELRASVRLLARTYIIHPLIARVSSDINLSGNIRNSGQQTRQSSNIAGALTLRLLSRSRYPSQVSISQSRQFLDFSLLDTPQFLSTTVTLQQRYRTLDNKENYFVRYSQTKTPTSPPRHRLSGSITTTRVKNQRLVISGILKRATINNKAEKDNRFVATQSFNFRKRIKINSFANLGTNNTQGRGTSNSLQFNTFAIWRPTKKPYLATASARFFKRTNTPFGSLTSDLIQSISGNIGISYRYARFISIFAAANASLTENNGVRTQNISISGTIATGANNEFRYPFKEKTFAGFRYTRDINISLSTTSSLTGTSAANTPSATSNSTLSLIAAPSHQLSRNMKMLGGTVALNLSQTLPSSIGIQSLRQAGQGTRMSLTNNLAAIWSNNTGTRIRLTGTDARSLIGNKSTFQSINLQASLRGSLSRYSSWNGSLTMQVAKGSTLLVGTSSSAALSYRHTRVFGYPRLLFTSTFHTSGRTIIPFQKGNEGDRVTSAWRSRLSYKIGRIEAGLEVEFATINNTQRSLILFTIERKFGAFR